MHRSWLFVLVLLLISAPSLGQSNSSDSQGMQALVAEVRQLRKNLQTTNGYALKAQILLYRLQIQEATVARVSQHLSDERSKLAQTQEHRRAVAASLKRSEEYIDNTEVSAADRKQIQHEISMLKAELENLMGEEQQTDRRNRSRGATADRASETRRTRRPCGPTRKRPGRQSAISSGGRATIVVTVV